MPELEKVKCSTPDLAAKNVANLLKLFPECEGEKGTVDLDKLRQVLSSNVVEGNVERYEFTWPGKRAAKAAASAATTKTLRPCREESVNFDTTENLYIEGDNLEVLKLLQTNYAGKVKMIYIDPPYNTDKDFIYRDRFSLTDKEVADKAGSVNEDGAVFEKNDSSEARYHTNWCNMFLPRIKLSKSLLDTDGIVYISIDDSEVSNLRKICDEVFGESNFIAQLVWQNKKGGGNDAKYFAIEHEYILAYAKNKDALCEFYEKYSEEYAKRYKEEDAQGKYFWDTLKRKIGKQYYPIVCPDGSVLQYDKDGNAISWLRSESRFLRDKESGEIKFEKKDGEGWSVFFKQRMPKGKTPRSLIETVEIISDQGTTSDGTANVYDYFKKHVFSNPKPISLLTFLMQFGVCDGDIVVDFFSGSATTADALLRYNAENGCKARYVLVQLKEDLDDNLAHASDDNARLVLNNAIAVLDELHRPHLLTEIAKERIRRAGKKIAEENATNAPNLDIGFRVLKLDSSSLNDTSATVNETDQKFENFDRIKSDRSSEDLLFQMLLETHIPLSDKIAKTTVGGNEVFVVGAGYDGEGAAVTQEAPLVACLDAKAKMTSEFFMEVAKLKPGIAFFRDDAFADDSARTNLQQAFNQFSPGTSIKVI